LRTGLWQCQPSADHRPAVLYDVVHFRLLCKDYLTLVFKKIRLLFSAVISEYLSKNRMIISVVAAKIWYLKNVRFSLGHPVYKRFGDSIHNTSELNQLQSHLLRYFYDSHCLCYGCNYMCYWTA